ncbi:hypothetical protein DID76_03045 [Candidatus Marinamargulisbacteria bacterium SCGC AG-414-C22]|nr:hypothetical protein DID76_03045 [Candidatus Marinamargulisbacteria bacterium SCGC AG-414-C22]
MKIDTVLNNTLDITIPRTGEIPILKKQSYISYKDYTDYKNQANPRQIIDPTSTIPGKLINLEVLSTIQDSQKQIAFLSMSYIKGITNQTHLNSQQTQNIISISKNIQQHLGQIDTDLLMTVCPTIPIETNNYGQILHKINNESHLILKHLTTPELGKKPFERIPVMISKEIIHITPNTPYALALIPRPRLLA